MRETAFRLSCLWKSALEIRVDRHGTLVHEPRAVWLLGFEQVLHATLVRPVGSAHVPGFVQRHQDHARRVRVAVQTRELRPPSVGALFPTQQCHSVTNCGRIRFAPVQAK